MTWQCIGKYILIFVWIIIVPQELSMTVDKDYDCVFMIP